MARLVPLPQEPLSPAGAPAKSGKRIAARNRSRRLPSRKSLPGPATATTVPQVARTLRCDPIGVNCSKACHCRLQSPILAGRDYTFR